MLVYPKKKNLWIWLYLIILGNNKISKEKSKVDVQVNENIWQICRKSWQLHNFYIKIVSLYYMLLLPHIHICSFLCVYYLEITVNLFLIVEINHKRVISLIHEISFWNKRKKWWVSQHEVYSCRYTHFFMLGKPLFSYVNVKIYLLCLMKILEIY